MHCCIVLLPGAIFFFPRDRIFVFYVSSLSSATAICVSFILKTRAVKFLLAGDFRRCSVEKECRGCLVV